MLCSVRLQISVAFEFGLPAYVFNVTCSGEVISGLDVMKKVEEVAGTPPSQVQSHCHSVSVGM